MVEIAGNYQHEKSENLDQYFQAIGISYIPRKMMCNTNPALQISVNENGEWTITSSTLLRTVTINFTLDKEYEEHMPGGVIIRSTTKKEDDNLKTISISPNGSRVIRTYAFTEKELILTLKHEETGTEAKRFFKRL